jgi:hypothetical protein
VMHAAAVDTVRTTTAIDQLNALLPAVPASDQQGLANALSRLALHHEGAVKQLTADVTSHQVGATAKATAAADLSADIKGQHHAINLLQAIAPLLPSSAQEGITTALASIAASLDRQASRITHARPNAPKSLRPLLTQAARRARNAATDATS